MNAPEYVTEVYPFYLRAADLGGRTVTVKIAAVELEVFHARDGSERPALVLSFEKARRKMILNKTQAREITRILQTERLGEWIGRTIALFPVSLPNGKQTIAIKEAHNGNVSNHA